MFKKSENLEQRLSSSKEKPFKKSTIKKITEIYFRPKSFECWKDGKLYECLGVKTFKKYLPTLGDIVSKKIGYRPIASANSKEEGLIRYEKQTKLFESIHIAGFCTMIPILPNIFLNGDYKGGLLLSLGDFAINVYPIMVQRYNRARIYNFLENPTSTND
jgi:glycosyl-4,4'-diaponeurosporenoate acyltransferase